MKDSVSFPWHFRVQTADVQFGLLDDWDISAEGKVYACADERMRDCNGDEIARVIEGFLWVHLTQTRVSLQKGFATLERVFSVRHLSALQNPPGPAIGGFVFVMSHGDALERHHYFSVNQQSENGDTGWQWSRASIRPNRRMPRPKYWPTSATPRWCGHEII